jgi:transcriptional regulator with XRE-family HTH domain
MPVHTAGGVGRRIAYYRSVMRPKLTQQQLADVACVALGTIRKIERGERGVTDATLEAIADALGVDPGRLRTDRGAVHTRVHDALPALSSAIATYDVPEDRADPHRGQERGRRREGAYRAGPGRVHAHAAR